MIPVSCRRMATWGEEGSPMMFSLGERWSGSSRRGPASALCLVLSITLLAAVATSASQGEDYRIGPRDLLEIRVSDNGKGIPLKNQGSIFDFDFTTKPKDQGTGLGLGICRRFVRENGGDLDIEESIEGKGTTFLATIPYINEV
jgi:signal transduction histidine kinase